MDKGEIYMALALEEARIALNEDNLPIGAVLVIGDKVVDKERNKNRTGNCWSYHAENSLVLKYSGLIKEAVKRGGLEVNLYTTMEPCLMCLGTAALHRVSNIVYACPDPIGGAATIDLTSMGTMYQTNFPRLEQGPFTRESYGLFIEFLSRHPGCAEMLKRYESFKKDILKTR